MQQHGSKYFFSRRPPHTPTTLGGLGQNLKFNFLEHGHVAYRITGNHKCSNMVANILPADPHPDPGDGA